jgi:hypothetical protein
MSGEQLDLYRNAAANPVMGWFGSVFYPGSLAGESSRKTWKPGYM